MNNEFSIEDVAQEHRITSCGTFNAVGGLCIRCNRMFDHNKNILGFSTPRFKSMIEECTIAIVSKCPNCGKVQWGHGDEDSYKNWLAWRHI